MADGTNDSTIQELEQKIRETEAERDQYLEALHKTEKMLQRVSTAYSMLLQSVTLAVTND